MLQQSKELLCEKGWNPWFMLSYSVLFVPRSKKTCNKCIGFGGKLASDFLPNLFEDISLNVCCIKEIFSPHKFVCLLQRKNIGHTGIHRTNKDSEVDSENWAKYLSCSHNCGLNSKRKAIANAGTSMQSSN